MHSYFLSPTPTLQLVLVHTASYYTFSLMGRGPKWAILNFQESPCCPCTFKLRPRFGLTWLQLQVQ